MMEEFIPEIDRKFHHFSQLIHDLQLEESEYEIKELIYANANLTYPCDDMRLARCNASAK
jgi:hypothetical protein